MNREGSEKAIQHQVADVNLLAKHQVADVNLLAICLHGLILRNIPPPSVMKTRVVTSHSFIDNPRLYIVDPGVEAKPNLIIHHNPK